MHCHDMDLTIVFNLFLADLRSISGRPYTFSLTEMQIATKYFDNDNNIGEGGFGTVYKVH
jgi:hypothetical protein